MQRRGGRCGAGLRGVVRIYGLDAGAHGGVAGGSECVGGGGDDMA